MTTTGIAREKVYVIENKATYITTKNRRASRSRKKINRLLGNPENTLAGKALALALGWIWLDRRGVRCLI